MMDLEGLREKWLQDQPLYEAFCQRVKTILEDEVHRSGISCTVHARSKDIASLLKKALRKHYLNPYEEILDKAGVRVICTYSDSLAALEEIVRKRFEVHKYENKTLGLDYDQLGYLGIHFEVSLAGITLQSDDRYRGLICEIQLHTRIQNLWSNISHELSYKPSQDPPPEIKRIIYRLVSIVEIFDDEVARSHIAILNLPGFQEARMLDQLEKHFYRFTAKSYDRELSVKILSGLQSLLTTEEAQGLDSLLEKFIERRSEKLAQIFAQYADDNRCNPLLFQPETLLIFERLEKDAFRLRETWTLLLPIELLESLATIWGVTV